MISIIIPTYNEELNIKNTLQQLWRLDELNLVKEIIIVDGGSIDQTVTIAKSEGVTVVVSKRKGRAAQMNLGASLASERVLYFLHADTIPPLNFSNQIAQSIANEYDAGCFRLSFDHDHWFLKANCWFTRFDVNAFRFGDQSLFVTKEKFIEAGSFCENHLVLEDQHLIKKLKNIARFTVMKKPVLTSARKYLENGIYRTQAIFFLVYLMYRLGFSQQRLVTTYKKLIRPNKL